MQFIDLAAQQSHIRDRIDRRIRAVLDHGDYIMGREVAELEEALAAHCDTAHCISCANGTDALMLVLMALGVGPGDAVFVPAFTFAATAEVVPLVGATPVFVDIDPTFFTMAPTSLERAIEHARRLGLRPSAVIPVDLFGLPADYDRLSVIAKANDLSLIADSAQGWGATYHGEKTGGFGTATTTSFFPAKPLGCYGDGGAVFTDDPELATHLRSLRAHGKGQDKYDSIRIGMNSRLDTLQAAVLLEKLAIYPSELTVRHQIASRYTATLKDYFTTPTVPAECSSIWAQYTLRARDKAARDATVAKLRAEKIPAAIYYPHPLHQQAGYADFPRDPSGLPHAENAASSVFSLPMHPYLSNSDQDRVIETLTSIYQ